MRAKALACLVCLVPLSSAAQDERVVLSRAEILRWDFDANDGGWRPILDAAPFGSAPGVLRILSKGTDPALLGPDLSIAASSSRRHVLRLQLKTPAGGTGQLFWATADAPHFDEARSVRFPLGEAGRFAACEANLADHPLWKGTITRLRIDPGGDPGPVEFDWIAVDEISLHPLALGPGVQEPEGEAVRVTHAVGNATDRAWTVRLKASAPPSTKVEGLPERLDVPAGGRAELSYAVRTPRPGVYPVDLELASDAPPLRRRALVRVYPSAASLAEQDVVFVERSARMTAAIWRPSGAPPSLLVYPAAAGGAAPAVDLSCLDHVVVEGKGGSREVLPLPAAGAGEEVRDAAGNVVARWTWSCAPAGPSLGVRAVLRAAAPLRVRRMEGVVLRIPGRRHDGGLFSGLEFLGRNEASSSTNDIEPPGNLRVVPDPLKVTMPLMGVLRDGLAVGLAWPLAAGTAPGAAILQPSFSVPNAVDGEPNLRMSLSLPAVGRGRRENAWEADVPVAVKAGESLEIEATLYLLPAQDLGGLIGAWLRDRPLPPPPPAARSEAAALDLARASYLDSALWDPAKKGWGHCAEKTWERHPFRDHLGYLWTLGLLGGKPDGPEARRVREVLAAHPQIPSGGAHVATRMIPFCLGPLEPCLAEEAAAAGMAIQGQRPDGLWTYEGRFRRGHDEDTASGYGAAFALRLLDHAKTSLDPKAREAGLRALEAMKRFRVPRGAQTWELSLHTPDILAAAHAVGAYVRGYELTGDPVLLEHARTWALSGLPFVYLWDRADLPTMRYATIAVYGATHWKAPNWIGLPVQWCGGVYAWRLLELARHDRSIDWRRVAEGIAAAAERMQVPEGPLAGCLPDSFDLARQGRNGPMINPGAVLALRLALGGTRPDAATDLAEWNGKPIAVTTTARDVRVATEAGGACVLTGRFHDGAAYHWFVAGTPPPAEVTVNGTPAPRVEAWPPAGTAWRPAAAGWIVRVGASKGSDEIRIR